MSFVGNAHLTMSCNMMIQETHWRERCRCPSYMTAEKCFCCSETSRHNSAYFARTISTSRERACGYSVTWPLDLERLTWEVPIVKLQNRIENSVKRGFSFRLHAPKGSIIRWKDLDSLEKVLNGIYIASLKCVSTSRLSRFAQRTTICIV